MTGATDLVSYNSMDAAAQQAHQNPPLRTRTNFCHIFPPSTNWGFINSFRSIDILTQLDGESIHSLENGFTMDVGLHGLFDDLQLWFEHIVVSS